MDFNKIKYLQKYGEAANLFTLTGNKILIERIDLGEVKTAGGLFVAEVPERRDLKIQRPHVGVVIATGQGYFNEETNSYTPLEVKVGNVVILNMIGVQYFSVLPGASNYTNNEVGLTTETDVQLRFESVKEFEAYERILQATTSR